MLTSAILSAIFLASGSMAQYYGGGSGWSSSASMAPSSKAANAAASWTSSSWPSQSSQPGTVQVQVVQVSNSNGSALKYYPEKVKAPPGSWVQFQFYPKNHTVTQSTFANPCVPIHDIMSNVTGIKSGFMPVSPGAAQIPVFSVLVNDTSPVWIYCGQPGHCQMGMAMVINENEASNKTLEAYKAAAAMLPPPSSSSAAGGYAGWSSSSTMSTAAAATMTMGMTTGMTTTTAMVATSLPTAPPTSSKTAVAPATFTGAANREAVGSSPLVGLLVAGLALAL